MFGNWQASFVINLSPYSFASPFFNGFAVSYDLCILLQYTRCQEKVKGNIFLVYSIFRKINLSCLLLVDTMTPPLMIHQESFLGGSKLSIYDRINRNVYINRIEK
ncbi:hypothetical protein BN000_01258 [Neobacillus massiliamazoniensis]|uniref:Uncharacterized protein n=1 Tax=Neobacillus massiliamazoniensis TaxID=1499688 RepID=A0A0U1NTI7_9BACI|nr:hypothetical protein BN000_01258 [Neobacillus massiliamazoniensis]